ncbi:MAG: protein kinase [Deltaproteobacteria bacterium]|nr:protein kinase [Deltaproteobacteria bacterium]
MTLAASRIVTQGETPHAHEREAIEFAINNLPNSDPFHLWALLELLDPSTGRLHEIDLLVLGYSALYLVEVKSGPGKYEGDTQDWWRTAPGEDRPRYLENPFRLTNHKAKILASRLRTKLKNPKDAPFIQPLVFLSAADLDLKLKSFGDNCVVTRSTFKDAMQFGRFTGWDGKQRLKISDPVMRDVAQAIAAIGLKPRKGKMFVGAYELGGVLVEGSGFQDRSATHRDNKSFTRRARIYTVSQASSVERRQQLRRAADREAQLLFDVREHANILRVTDYVTDAELGPTVLFDAFDGAMPLDAFLRKEQLDFFARVEIIEQIARALAHCHRKRVVHGALSPEAVLVRRHPETKAIEVRLFNFQLGLGAGVDATMHWSALASEPWAIYQAPELREDPTNRSPTSDMFSLGALAYLVFTGRAPGTSAIEIDQRLAKSTNLDPRVADDGIQKEVADLIAQATDRSPINRLDDAETWIEILLAEVTRPEPAEPQGPELNPLEARPDDLLGNELVVESTSDGRPTLGQGATSRVLQVGRVTDGRSYALKVSSAPEHDERLGHEADELGRLRHPRIVQLVDRYTFAGRPCLLLSIAGAETLHRYLTREGSVSLERAARYGEDLLSALDYLEEQRVLHRDLKPANIGVGSTGKQAAHLTLFDFSLAAAPVTDIQVGTAAYRDPFLRLRGSWDYAAERWSAAVTLHEMLTGLRPSFDRPVVDPEASLVLAVERLDASVRESLDTFFRRALNKDIENRFGSTEEMRRAWHLALNSTTSTDTDVDAPVDVPVTTDAQLAAIPPETSVEALPLSPRARNALDRAGFLTARDLLGLADNQLSAIRGIGRLVAKEILEFKERWANAQADTVIESKPFFLGFRGDNLSVESAGLVDTAQRALQDAGLTTLGAVAAAPLEQVRALAHRHGFDEKALRELLSRENADANERERPSTLEGWVDALLPKKKKALKHARELYGLDEPFVGRLDLTVRELADMNRITTAAVYIPLGKARDGWAKHGALPELRRQAHLVVDQAGGAAPLAQAAASLKGLIPYSRSTPEPEVIASAAALLRVVAEVEKDEDGGLRTLRVGEKSLWLCASDAHGRGVKALGEAADRLAQRPSVPGPGEAARVFEEAVLGTPLSSLPTERLADLAAAASTMAARSARLEIYPVGMAPERALALSASQLKSGLTPAEIIRRVSLRYPDAKALPPRTALDELLKPHGLVFDEVTSQYTRPGEPEHTHFSSKVSSLLRVETALPSQPLSMEPDAVAARQFDERLRNAFERHELRVLGVRADRAREAALALGKRLGAQPVAFDKVLVAAIREQMRLGGVKREELIHDADRAGRNGSTWKNLLKLVEKAADAVALSLLPPKEPLLLVQPGLIARYRLEAFTTRLMDAAKGAEAPVFLLVPSLDTGGIPTINREYAIPGLLASQVLWVSPDWLTNQHNRAA